jgi:O-antigen/teichoic acid export membrane protein
VHARNLHAREPGGPTITFAPPRVVGTYAAAYRAYTVLLTVAAAASPVLMTLFVSLRLAGRSQEARQFVERIAPALTLVAGGVIALLIAPAYALVPVVFGRAFAGGALPLAILLVGSSRTCSAACSDRC